MRGNLDSTGSKVFSVRVTQIGNVLIVMSKESNNEGSTAELKRMVEVLGEMRANPKKVTLEVRDLDLTELVDVSKVKILNPKQRRLKLVAVALTEKEAVKLQQPHLKIEMKNYRVQRRLVMTRYFGINGVLD